MKKVILLALLLAAGQLPAGELKPYQGAPLPDFILRDMQGQPHALSANKGKVVMVNFWATYCGPCLKEMPSMQRLKEKMAGKPFVILAVDMAEEPTEITDFLQRHGIQVDFPILLDPDAEVIQQWMISAVPTTFILDPKGTIRYALYGGLEWDSDEVVNALQTLLGD